MITNPRIVGNHVYFFRDGDAFVNPAAGIASRTAKPNIADPSWLEIGRVDNLSLTHDKEEKEVYAPNPSLLELDDILYNKRKITAKFDSQELSPLVYELGLHTQPLTGTHAANQAAYNPGTAQPVKGWLHIEQFAGDSDVTPINIVEMYVYLTLDSDIKFDDNVVKPSFAATKLRSTLNVGALIAG